MRDVGREQTGRVSLFLSLSPSPLDSLHHLHLFFPLRSHLPPASLHRWSHHPCRTSTPCPPEALHLLRPGWSHPSPLPCSAKRADSSASGGALVSRTSVVSSPSNRIQLKGTVSWSQISLPLQVLVDSGANGNFFDSFVSHSNLPY